MLVFHRYSICESAWSVYFRHVTNFSSDAVLVNESVNRVFRFQETGFES